MKREDGGSRGRAKKLLRHLKDVLLDGEEATVVACYSKFNSKKIISSLVGEIDKVVIYMFGVLFNFATTNEVGRETFNRLVSNSPQVQQLFRESLLGCGVSVLPKGEIQ